MAFSTPALMFFNRTPPLSKQSVSSEPGTQLTVYDWSGGEAEASSQVITVDVDVVISTSNLLGAIGSSDDEDPSEGKAEKFPDRVPSDLQFIPTHCDAPSPMLMLSLFWSPMLTTLPNPK